jgi:hypothetical protein
MERERDEVITVNRLTKRFELPSLSTYQTRTALELSSLSLYKATGKKEAYA